MEIDPVSYDFSECDLPFLQELKENKTITQEMREAIEEEIKKKMAVAFSGFFPSGGMISSSMRGMGWV